MGMHALKDAEACFMQKAGAPSTRPASSARVRPISSGLMISYVSLDLSMPSCAEGGAMSGVLDTMAPVPAGPARSQQLTEPASTAGWATDAGVLPERQRKLGRQVQQAAWPPHLVDARLVGKGVGTHDGLVRLDGHAAVGRHHPRRGRQVHWPDAGPQAAHLRLPAAPVTSFVFVVVAYGSPQVEAGLWNS